jgi:hypothetical protein
MSLHVDVRTDSARLALSRLRADVRGPALARALNRTAVTVRAEAARALRGDMRGGQRVSELKRAIGIERATTIKLAARVVPSRRMTLPLTTFVGKIIFVECDRQLHQAMKVLLDEELLGFDTETRPIFRKDDELFDDSLRKEIEEIRIDIVSTRSDLGAS